VKLNITVVNILSVYAHDPIQLRNMLINQPLFIYLYRKSWCSTNRKYRNKNGWFSSYLIEAWAEKARWSPR